MLLADPIRRLLGLNPLVDRRFESAHFYFGCGLSVKIASGILLAGAIWFGWCYLRDGARPSFAVKIPLLLLRLVAVASLLAMLLQPMIRLQKSESQKSSVVVLVDDSKSMELKDPRLRADLSVRLARGAGEAVGGQSRAAILEKMIHKARLIPYLAGRYNLRVYRFASDSRAVDIP